MEKEGARCPKCGFERLPGAAECPVCGVVFAKLERGASLAAPPPYAPPTSGAPRQAGTGPAAPLLPSLWDGPPGGALAPPAHDPYAAPRSDFMAAGPSLPGTLVRASGAWHSGELVIVPIGADLPDRCVFCNAPPVVRLRKRLYWHSPWLYLLVVQVLIYLIVALSVRKSIQLGMSLCAVHRRRRRRNQLIAWSICAAGLVLAIVGMSNDESGLAFCGIGLMVGGLAAVAIVQRLLVPRRIDKEHAWLRGAGADFLVSLPAGPDLPLR